MLYEVITHVHDRKAGNALLGDTDQHRMNGMVRVLGLLHGKPHEVETRRDDFVRNAGGEAPRQIGRAYGPVFILSYNFV